MQKGFIICVDDQPEIVGSLLTQLEHAVGHEGSQFLEIVHSRDPNIMTVMLTE